MLWAYDSARQNIAFSVPRIYSSSDCTACEPFVEWQFTTINLVGSFVL